MKKALYLEISRRGEDLEICLSEGDQTVTHYEECRVPNEDLERRSAELLHLLNSVSRQGKIPAMIFQELQQMGQVLYNEIFPLRIKKELADTRASDLIIRIDNRLVQIPWELMYTGQEFFCERFNIGRMVKTQQVVSGAGQKKPHSPFKMLIVADPKGDLASAYEEGNRIKESFNLKNVSMTMVSSEVSVDYLKKKLLQFDLIHYAGHADYDLKDPSLSGWILEDGKFTALDIRKISGINPMPPLVFSNACQSGATEEWQVGTSSEEKIYGLANAFLLAGVQHYIGTFWKVLDKPSTSFAIEFYTQLFAGQGIGQAMRLARQALKDRYGRENVFWASYLLYGDPTAQYVESVYDEKFDERKDALISGINVSDKRPGIRPGKRLDMDWLIQEKSNHGVLWKTRSPSELMERNIRAEEQYKQNRGDISVAESKASWSRYWYMAALAGGLAMVSVLYPLMNRKDGQNHKPTIQSHFLAGDLSTAKAPGAFPIDWSNENAVGEFFQKLVGKYRAQETKSALPIDTWTSRPITIFFNTKNTQEEAKVAILINKIIQQLQKNSHITVLEREQLEVILRELALSSSDLASSDSTLRLGKLLTSTLLNTCSLYQNDSALQINMRIIENETTVIKAALSEEWDKTISEEVMAERLSQKIIEAIDHHFPLQGKIKALVDYDRVLLNIGADNGVKVGRKFIVLKEQKIYQNGEVVSEENVKVGEIEVNEVRADYSFSKVLGRSEDLTVGMKVVPLVTATQN